jgi:hypothetical protein
VLTPDGLRNKEIFMKAKKITLFLTMIIAMIPCLCWANQDIIDPIDKRLEECINRDSTTSGMVNCAIESEESWDKELNVVYE